MKKMNLKFRKLAKKDYMSFYNSLKAAREENMHALFVLLRDPKVYMATDNFLLDDGVAGFAVCDGELISVHKNNVKAKKANVEHVLPEIVRCAFENGAFACDCYGEFLGEYYTSCGFAPVAVVPFEFVDNNPVDWDYDKFGKPNDYVLMRVVKDDATLQKLKESGALRPFEDWRKIARKFENYEDALKFRDGLYEKVKKLDYDSIFEMLAKAK